MSRLRTWAADLILGVRLAIGDRHSPWGRLALMTVGVGIGVAVLLASASMPAWMDGRDARIAPRNMQAASSAQSHTPAAVLGIDATTSFHDKRIEGRKLQPQRPDAPLPAGLHRYPAPGELVVSPALQALLEEPGSELLRQRLDGRIVDQIGPEGLLVPGELYYYAGTTGLTEWNATHRVDDHFGEAREPGSLPQDAWLMWVMGVSVLLLPVVVFVVSTARLAEAARQRRLAALRLVGASAWQVRRIASGESLVGSVAGVVAGWAMFLSARAIAGSMDVVTELITVTDITPVWWMAVLITLGVPVVTVLVSLASLRGAVREPLRWVRQGLPVRRRLWVRCVPLVAGVAGVLATRAMPWNDQDIVVYGLVGSISLILVSVPLLLPWTLDALAQRSRGGPVAWQLALRRLHFTSGTAARSVSAIAVVVTGVIGLQTLIATSEQSAAESRSKAVAQPNITVTATEDLQGRDGLTPSLAEIRSIPGVRAVSGDHSVDLRSGGTDPRWLSVKIADCATIARLAQVDDCADGAAYRTDQGRGQSADVDSSGLRVDEGDLWEIYTRGTIANGAGTVAWQVPPLQDVGATADRMMGTELLLTPAAATGIPMETRSVELDVEVDDDAPPELIESVRNVVAANLTAGSVEPPRTNQDNSDEQIRAIKYALLLGALVTFSLIGCSLLVTAIEQIQERTRPMAVLGAVGARRSTLVWSAFLQNAVPMLLTAVLAVPVGLGLGALLIVTLLETFPVFDFVGIGAVLSFAAVSVLVVTALTAPALSRAMSSEGLHTE
ncbi:FtsX-like permease family protein [Saccharopolyspora gloriosae]|uniref:FtsX-like permease family protein n=1 Tax=Saccharopolyspora gloriosae TaxID=455344 RepID=UPI001FB58457|nr:FtsX-like permease family protein [Saccharopolyspora gloriosae]